MNQRRGSVLTFESIAEQYPPNKFILVKPQVQRHLLTTVPMWSLDVATVKVDTSNDKEAYKIAGGQYGLGKVIIDTIADAADVSVAVRRIDDRRDRMRAEFEAHAIMTTPSGGVRGSGRTCEWDGELAEAKVRLQAKRYIRMAIDKGWRGFDNLSPQQEAAAIEDRFEEQWIKEREFGKRVVESKAANRAIRALLGLQTSYQKADLDNKPFAIVRFVFTPDLDDRDVKMLVVSRGLDAQRGLFGSPATPALPPVSTAAALPADIAEQSAYEDPASDQAIEAEVIDAEPAGDPIDQAGKDLPPVVDFDDAVAAWGTEILTGLANVDAVDEMRKLKRRYDKAIQGRDGGDLQKIHNYMVAQGHLDS